MLKVMMATLAVAPLVAAVASLGCRGQRPFDSNARTTGQFSHTIDANTVFTVRVFRSDTGKLVREFTWSPKTAGEDRGDQRGDADPSHDGRGLVPLYRFEYITGIGGIAIEGPVTPDIALKTSLTGYMTWPYEVARSEDGNFLLMRAGFPIRRILAGDDSNALEAGILEAHANVALRVREETRNSGTMNREEK